MLILGCKTVIPKSEPTPRCMRWNSEMIKEFKSGALDDAPNIKLWVKYTYSRTCKVLEDRANER